MIKLLLSVSLVAVIALFFGGAEADLADDFTNNSKIVHEMFMKISETVSSNCSQLKPPSDKTMSNISQSYEKLEAEMDSNIGVWVNIYNNISDIIYSSADQFSWPSLSLGSIQKFAVSLV